jgi:hypothetical protein
MVLLSVLFTSVFGSSPAKADDSPFYFDESGSMQQRDYWSPSNRSLDHEYDRLKQNQYQNQETQRQNEEGAPLVWTVYASS